VDGVFFLRESDHGGINGIPRLAAAVVAPTLSAATLMRHLRRRIDPVFLPRPLVIVDRLPRNATGKLPQQALQALADRRPRRAAPAATHRRSPRSLS
jgi:acyl-coenzyme A synthetase/AMP-(fatty) acid ligase